MQRKRDRLEIIHEILGTVRARGNSIRPTPLMRAANLSSAGFSEYCRELVEKGLIREEAGRGGKYITLTDKGFAFLEKYAAIRSVIDEFDL